LSECKLLPGLPHAALFTLGVFSLVSLSPLSAGEITIYSSGGVESFPVAESPRSNAEEGGAGVQYLNGERWDCYLIRK